jgi:outer membrane receptor protein involved in Fe transport
MAIKLRTWRVALLAGCATAALATALPAEASAEGPARQYSITSQDLDSALRAFAMASGHDVVFDPALVRGRTTAGVNGEVSDEAALRALLVGTDLAFEQTSTGGFVVRAPRFQAAPEGGADGTVQALIVTAQKREEDIQDVPIAISAFTQEDLTRSQVAGGPDLVTQVPNFTFTKTNFSGYSIQIRGIGTQAISATTDPAVAVAFNNTPFIHNRFFEQEFYDLERVEVLRGPQGTLYGRNATAGVVNIISAKPKFRYEAKLSGDIGNYSSSRFEGMVNIPLVEDKVALRLAGAWTKREGYVTNQLAGSQTDGRDLWSTRLSLRVQPTDRLNMNLIWEHFQENDDRLRSGKQLCHKDVVTQVGDAPVTSYWDVRNEGSGNSLIFSGVQGTFSQGCIPHSLYDQGSFQRPNGLMLPYYGPLGAIGLPAALADPYEDVVAGCTLQGGPCDMALLQATPDQPQDLRVIQTQVAPDYRAKSDLGELQISYDLTDHLTLSSETAYNRDFVWSLEDYNRFKAASGAWGGGSSAMPEWIARGVLRTDLGPNLTFCDPQLGCSDKLMGVDIATSKSSQFSQEFRLASNFDGAFNFSLGANFLRSDSMDKYYVFFNSTSLIAAAGPPFNTYGNYIPGVTDNVDFMINGYLHGDPNAVYPVQANIYMDPNPINSLNDEGHNYFLSKNPYKLISYAVFGEAYYKITDNLKLTAGLRWTVDKKEAPRIPTWILASYSVGYPVAEVIRQRWSKPTGRVTLDWKPDLPFTDETLLYASIAHGYKAGGANPPGYVREFYADSATALQNAAEAATRPKTFDPEYVNAFEIGSKNTFAGGRVTANLAAFYYDYTGYQVSEIVDRSAFNRNFDSKVWGAELEADWRPLENLRLGFKGGYERTRINDSESAVDLMDRANGGKPDANGISWMVVRPFPTYASSCILPIYVFVNPDHTIAPVGGVGGGNPGACEYAYSYGVDPVYGPDGGINHINEHPGYPGFDPFTAPNGGAGISKPLGGNDLPNAPHWTGTVTADYTVPLPSDWLMTLHSDVHWQSQSWWRVFNDNVYDKLHPYFTMNLAAIFTNEDAGWNVMAYIKNVTDETAITGAFLNSDDTGLTTNVFLTEPRLYGLRVTKNWSGGSMLGSFGAPHDGPYPFTVETGGQIQRQNAPNQALMPGFASAFPAPIDILATPQGRDLDWGNGGYLKLTYQPTGSPWRISTAVRYGRTNGSLKAHAEHQTDPVCVFGGYFASFCDYFTPDNPKYKMINQFSIADHADSIINDREEHTLVDFAVGRDVGLGQLEQSSLSLGLRHADFKSTTMAVFRGIPDWDAHEGFISSFYGSYVAHTRYDGVINARRDFKGLGPVAAWEASYPVLGNADLGRVAIDWSVSGGVLLGTQKVSISGSDKASYFLTDGLAVLGLRNPDGPVSVTETPVGPYSRSKSVTVPTAAVSLGLSYQVERFQMGAGYRWERYFNAIDGGFTERKSYDRTIDGPYFKVSVGFGG